MAENNEETTPTPAWAYLLVCGGQNAWPPLHRTCDQGGENHPSS